MGTGVGPLTQYLCVPLACMRACSVMSDSDTGWTSPPGSTVHGIIPARIWSGLLFPTPRELPDTGIEPTSPLSPVSPLPPALQAYQAGSLPLRATWEAHLPWHITQQMQFIFLATGS